jgi:hypothetical protein
MDYNMMVAFPLEKPLAGWMEGVNIYGIDLTGRSRNPEKAL